MAKNKKPIVIAIDGPAASGKGSLGRKLAKHLGLEYLDTGKLYRYVGVKLMQSGVDIKKAEDHNSDVSFQAIEISKNIRVNEMDKEDLQCEGVGAAASIVSAIPGVRKALLDFQRSVGISKNGAVLDGRDIGTVVFPEADFKFFITANIEVRAERRYKELQKHRNGVIYSSVLEDLKERDKRDSMRKISPLRPAKDAIHIDTTYLDADEVFRQVLQRIENSRD